MKSSPAESQQSVDNDIIQVFLSYAREDEAQVSEIYDRLKGLALKPWMDKRDLLAGELWREVIRREVEKSDIVLVFLSSHSVTKRGFFQREISIALEAAEERLNDDIYLVPVRLESCDVPSTLDKFHWVDLEEESGWTLMLRSLQSSIKRLDKTVPDQLNQLLNQAPIADTVSVVSKTTSDADSDAQVGQMLSDAVRIICNREGKDRDVVLQELAFTIGRGRELVERWLLGETRLSEADLESLALLFYQRRIGDNNWLTVFLSLAGHPYAEDVVSNLYDSPGQESWSIRDHFD